MNNARQYAPATERNRDPILEVLLEVLPPTGTVLEISSGTGEHAAYFATRLQPRRWLPSDLSAEARDSIEAWRSTVNADNLHPPIALDASQDHWAVEDMELEQPIGAIVNINMIHIAPWSACLGLMAGAKRILPKGGILYLYGPFKQKGLHTAPSNMAFDQTLQMRDREWGVRDLEAVIAAAEAEGLAFVKTYSMPANNLSVVFKA
jgi:cyclopropane fatty-acyl-phospholipid synthase-like methyltransferase